MDAGSVCGCGRKVSSKRKGREPCCWHPTCMDTKTCSSQKGSRGTNINNQQHLHKQERLGAGRQETVCAKNSFGSSRFLASRPTSSRGNLQRQWHTPDSSPPTPRQCVSCHCHHCHCHHCHCHHCHHCHCHCYSVLYENQLFRSWVGTKSEDPWMNAAADTPAIVDTMTRRLI